jgi:hypothetical protein
MPLACRLRHKSAARCCGVGDKHSLALAVLVSALSACSREGGRSGVGKLANNSGGVALSGTAQEQAAPRAPVAAPSLPAATASAAAAAPLLFRGRVVEMAPWSGGAGRYTWQVTMQVEQVLEGAFVGERFSFVLHSPAKAGLEKGSVREVRATPVEGGYVVDPRQFSAGK